MATKLGFFEKIANLTGVLYRHQAKQFPRRLDILTKVAKRELAPPRTTDWPIIKKEFQAVVKAIESRQFNNLTVRVSLFFHCIFIYCIYYCFIYFRKQLYMLQLVWKLFSGFSLVK